MIAAYHFRRSKRRFLHHFQSRIGVEILDASMMMVVVVVVDIVNRAGIIENRLLL